MDSRWCAALMLLGSAAWAWGETLPSVAERVTKAPYSGRRVLTSKQFGKTTVTVIREYRDSEGRTRTERSLEVPSSPGDTASPPKLTEGVEIGDPVAGVWYTLDVANRIAYRQWLARTSVTEARPPASNDLSPYIGVTDACCGHVAYTVQPVSRDGGLGEGGPGINTFVPPLGPSGPRTRSLGKAMIEGVPVKGQRTTEPDPALFFLGSRGVRTNDVWMSPDLKVAILSRTTEPGLEKIDELANIVRTEPDPTLFRVPTGYRIVAGGSGFTLRFR